MPEKTKPEADQEKKEETKIEQKTMNLEDSQLIKREPNALRLTQKRALVSAKLCFSFLIKSSDNMELVEEISEENILDLVRSQVNIDQSKVDLAEIQRLDPTMSAALAGRIGIAILRKLYIA